MKKEALEQAYFDVGYHDCYHKVIIYLLSYVAATLNVIKPKSGTNARRYHIPRPIDLIVSPIP